jgi:hypothetical protein
VRYRDLIFMLVSLSGAAVSQAQNPSPAPVSVATPAIEGVLAAFQKNPLVGLSDDHALAQEEDFYVALISDPGFAKEVGNVVVEFGNASQQQTIDRYVNGEDVPYVELRKVWGLSGVNYSFPSTGSSNCRRPSWGDTSYVGWFPTVTALGYVNFYAAVRAANLKLPVQDRIHVWLGGKPIEWSTIRTKEDLAKVVGGPPDRYTADLIEEQILAKNRKALLIYGTFHFYDKEALGELLRQRHPGTLFVNYSLYRLRG